MIDQYTQVLQKFISANNLKREDGIILFGATVNLTTPCGSSQILSEIEVITLPSEIALYILEYFGEENPEKEMYRTSQHQFVCSSAHVLEIIDSELNTRLKISVKAAGTPQ